MALLLKSGEKNNRHFIVIGKIVSAHGLKGAVNVYPLTDFPERLLDLRQVFLLSHDESEVIKSLQVIQVRAQSKYYVMHFQESHHRSEAEQMAKHLIAVPQEEAISLPVDTFYIHELVGLDVYLLSGEKIGIVNSVIPGSQDLLEIYHCEQNSYFLIPFVKQWVPLVDLENKRIQVQPVDDLQAL